MTQLWVCLALNHGAVVEEALAADLAVRSDAPVYSYYSKYCSQRVKHAFFLRGFVLLFFL